ncbi:MAG: hypothetical protein ACYTF6_14680, partial [Planctomycetota bacterium]
MPSMQEHYRLPESFPSFLLCLAALAALAAWVAAHMLKIRPRRRPAKVLLFAARTSLAFGLILLMTQVAMRWLLLTTSWPMWTLAATGALATECVIGLYGLERRTVSRRAGMALVGLRSFLIMLVIAMLAQPVLAMDLSKELRRIYAILFDDSGSAHIADRQMTGAEKAQLADYLPLDAAHRPYRLDEIKRSLEKTQTALESQLQRIAAAGDVTGLSARQRGLERIREDLHKATAEEHKRLQEQLETLNEPLSKGAGGANVQRDLADVKGQLTVQVRDRLERVVKMTEPEETASLGRNYERLRELIGAAGSELGQLAPRLESLATALDEDFYANLPEELKAKVDKLASQTRFNLSMHISLHEEKRPGEERALNLVDRLRGKGYLVKTFKFAKEIEEFDFDDWRKRYEGVDSSRPPVDALDPARQQSSGGRALKHLASSSLGGGELAEVMVFTDARFTDAAAAVSAAQQLGSQGVPVKTVLLGSRKAPRDAAILSLDAPAVAYPGDKIEFKIQLKIDGLAGQKGRLVLHKLKPGENKESDKPIKHDFTVPANAESYNLTVELTDKDTEEPGLRQYEAKVTSESGEYWQQEVATKNNTFPIAVNVSD